MRITVATMNIRYGHAADGSNHWDRRWPLAGNAISGLSADVLCLQEALPFQAEHAKHVEPRYDWVGASRDDGRRTAGEMVPIFWRADALARIDAGHFWLSPDPHIPGVPAWGAPYPRMVTWVALRAAGGPAFTVFNTHLDFASQHAREESAKLLHRRATALGAGMPVLVLGDFNCTDADPPYSTLRADRLAPGDGLRDAYREVHPTPGPDEGTTHKFTGRKDGERIDMVFASPHWKVKACRIDHTSRDGAFPSDHFPVVAQLELGAA